jgi:hypothetical protein
MSVLTVRRPRIAGMIANQLPLLDQPASTGSLAAAETWMAGR